jgi:hypothetical protein
MTLYVLIALGFMVVTNIVLVLGLVAYHLTVTTGPLGEERDERGRQVKEVPTRKFAGRVSEKSL